MQAGGNTANQTGRDPPFEQINAGSAQNLAAGLLQVAGPETPVPEALLTVAEAAKRLRLSKRTVYLHCEVGRIAHLRLGNTIRIPESAIAALLQAGRRGAP